MLKGKTDGTLALHLAAAEHAAPLEVVMPALEDSHSAVPADDEHAVPVALPPHALEDGGGVDPCECEDDDQDDVDVGTDVSSADRSDEVCFSSGPDDGPVLDSDMQYSQASPGTPMSTRCLSNPASLGGMGSPHAPPEGGELGGMHEHAEDAVPDGPAHADGHGAPAPPAPASVAASARSGVRRSADERSIPSWGPFRLTFSNKTPASFPHGRWQATCPYHAKNSKTACTRSMGLRSPEDVDRVKLLMMHWCIQAFAFDRKWKHSKFPLKDSDVLPEERMFAKALTLPEPPSKEELLDDDFLDACGSGPETAAAGYSSGFCGSCSRRRCSWRRVRPQQF